MKKSHFDAHPSQNLRQTLTVYLWCLCIHYYIFVLKFLQCLETVPDLQHFKLHPLAENHKCMNSIFCFSYLNLSVVCAEAVDQLLLRFCIRLISESLRGSR